MLNEILCKIVCHNLCVLIMAIFERGLDLDDLLGSKTHRPDFQVSEAGTSRC